MATDKIYYLVTSMELGDVNPEALMQTPELAQAMADRLPGGDVIPMPVLDYVPEKVTVWTYALVLAPGGPWRMNLNSPMECEEWDFEAPKLAVRVQADSRVGNYLIRISHRDKDLARIEAERMLAELTTGTGDGTT